jgi:hypothetical protein
MRDERWIRQDVAQVLPDQVVEFFCRRVTGRARDTTVQPLCFYPRTTAVIAVGLGTAP